MNLNTLRQLIREELEQTMQMAPQEETPMKLDKDEVGKFYVVFRIEHPDQECLKEYKNLMEFAHAVAANEADYKMMEGVYSNSGAAKKRSNEIKEEVETTMNEIKQEAERYREEKQSHAERKKGLAEKIRSLKKK